MIDRIASVFCEAARGVKALLSVLFIMNIVLLVLSLFSLLSLPRSSETYVILQIDLAILLSMLAVFGVVYVGCFRE